MVAKLGPDFVLPDSHGSEPSVIVRCLLTYKPDIADKN